MPNPPAVQPDPTQHPDRRPQPATAGPAPLLVAVDVTDTVATEWRAGIQRVVSELVRHLDRRDELEVVPVVWLESARSFRRLTEHERARLNGSGHPSRPAPESAPAGSASARLRRLASGVRRAVVGVLTAARIEPVLRHVRRWVLIRTRDRHLAPLTMELPPGSVLLELDTVWNNLWVDRDELYASLQRAGVHVAVMVYDLLPQLHPEWFEPPLVRVSDSTITAQARRAELVMAISTHTAETFRTWAAGSQLRAAEPHVVRLGADVPTGHGHAEVPHELRDVPFVLTVGTIEPRKNHGFLLDVFERLVAAGSELHLVVVGRPGWNNDEVLGRLGGHPLLGSRVHWLRNCGDDLLGELYDRALLVAVPSVTEGYGLPVIEALGRGVPVVSSPGGALAEAGGDLVDRVPLDDPDRWVEAIRRHHEDLAHHASRRARVAGYVAPSWTDAAEQVCRLLVEHFARTDEPGGHEPAGRVGRARE